MHPGLPFFNLSLSLLLECHEVCNIALPCLLSWWSALLCSTNNGTSYLWLTPLKSWAKTNVCFSKLFPWDIFPVMKSWLSITLYYPVVLEMMPCCTYVWVCVYVGVHAHVFIHMSRSEVCLGYLPLKIYTLFCETTSFWILSISVPLTWVYDNLQVFAYLHFSSPGITDVYHHTQLFIWVVGIKAQVLMCMQTQLHEMSCIPIPFPLIFDYRT